MIRAVLEEPILLLVVLFLPTLFLLSRFVGRWDIPFRAIFFCCGGICIAGFLLILLANLRRTGMISHDEAHILAIAASYLRGAPMYPGHTPLYFYALVYGPSSYLIYVPFLAGFGHPIVAIRMAIIAIDLGSLALIFFILRTQLSRAASFALLPILTAFMLCCALQLLGARGDPWMLLLVSAALFCIMRSSGMRAAIAFGLFCAIAIDFKPTIVPVVWVMLAVTYRRNGLRTMLVGGFTSIAGALAIFLLPRVSLSSYLGWLMLSSRRATDAHALVDILLASLFLIALIIFLAVFGSRAERQSEPGWVLVVLGMVALAACIVTGSKVGAGIWHLWPMLPLFLLWSAHEASVRGADASQPSGGAAQESSKTREPSSRTLCVMAAMALAATVVTLRYGFRDIRIIQAASHAEQRGEERAAEQAIRDYSHASWGGRNLAMGYGADAGDYRSDLRFELALEGQQYFFDENAMIEGIKENIPIPAGVVQRILGCKDVWLIPHGDIPFSTLRTGSLPITTTPYLFPDSIRLHFVQSHVRIETRAVYDLWGCPSTR